MSCAFKRTTRFKIGGDPGRAEGMAADLDLHAKLGGAALDHAIGVDPVHGLAVQQTEGIATKSMRLLDFLSLNPA
jgi:hypothetical protein